MKDRDDKTTSLPSHQTLKVLKQHNNYLSRHRKKKEFFESSSSGLSIDSFQAWWMFSLLVFYSVSTHRATQVLAARKVFHMPHEELIAGSQLQGYSAVSIETALQQGLRMDPAFNPIEQNACKATITRFGKSLSRLSGATELVNAVFDPFPSRSKISSSNAVCSVRDLIKSYPNPITDSR